MAPGFWDDPRKAQTVNRRRASIQQTMDGFEKLWRDVDDAKVLLELGAAENDEATMQEVAATLPALARRVRESELSRMLSGPVDHSSAIVSIHPGAGGNDAKDWAQMLMRMYMRWAERRGFKTELLDYAEGDEAGIDAVSFE